MTIAKKVDELKERWEEFLKEDRHYVGSCQDLDPADVWQFILEVIGEVEEEAKKEVLDEVRKETFRVEGTSYGCMKHYGTEPDTCKGCLNANTRNEERKSVAERIRTFCQSLKS